MDSCQHITRIRPSKQHSVLFPQKWRCSICGTTESVYACLSCSHVACGRFNEEHSLQHYRDTKHPIAIEINNKFVYCYDCDDYVLNDNPSGDIQQLRTALSAIATQSFQEVDPRARPLLRSISVHEDSSAANIIEDKLRTADACRRTFLLRKAFQGWRTFVEEKQSEAQGKKRKLSPLAEDSTHSSTSVKRPAIIPGVTGLRNLGNTCYMNSILQVLSHLETFRTFFLKLVPESGLSPWRRSSTRTACSTASCVSSRNLTRQTTMELFLHLSEPEDPKQKGKGGKGMQKQGVKSSGSGLSGGGGTGADTLSCRDEEVDGSDNGFVSLSLELHALFRVLWSGKWAQVSPHAFLHAVWKSLPAFKGYSQQDAQEFLCELLEKVQEELKSEGLRDLALNAGMSDVVSLVFQGELASQVTCLMCDYHSRTVEPFTDLSLEFPERYQVSDVDWSKPRGPCYLTEMLETFTEVEVLDGEIYACEQCNKKRRNASKKPVVLTDAKKQLLVSHLPQVLRLHLKRFRWSGRYHREKICSHVSFERILDMEPYCDESLHNSPCVYHLSGVVVHHGVGFGCGHYTAYIWSEGADSWVWCNDAKQELCSWEKVCAAQAYILFYTMDQCGGKASPRASQQSALSTLPLMDDVYSLTSQSSREQSTNSLIPTIRKPLR
ncbi:ubiquitin carboxyl-terminal hydrolase 44-like [Liolophura sinensis]|uniref:ubiquitin carboxyl-terminal hydrolase 44-like n=1 Tax=Liolophura sinensis TaxID=3198878 RepID=UPI0031582EDA